MQVVVIGGGPAGMTAAITAAQNGCKVILLEKMQSLGRKLLITGKGRCNITSSLSMEKFISNTPQNGKFLYSVYTQYTNKDIIDFLKKQGLEVKEERGNRIFPITDKSIDVLKCFTKKLKELNVDIRLNSRVEEIITSNSKVEAVKVNGEIIKCKKVILATGGKSYHATGSTGDGYEFVKKLGHNITKIRGSLIPYECYEVKMCKELQGLSLRNIKIRIIDIEKNKKIFEEFGEMMFTHFGLSGPIILTSSAHLIRYKNIEELLKNKKIIIQIDLKPALTEQQLKARIDRDFEEFKNKEYKNSLEKLLPKKLIDVIIEKSKIDPYKKVNEITKEEKNNLVNLFKNFEVTIKDFRPIDEAIITSGGIDVKEINPQTMESKIVKGLYFAGEIIDVDSYTGGFNLQIAYSTGFVAGNLLSKE